MTSKTFTTGTVIDKDWLNDVNGATYNGTAVYTPSGTGAVARTVGAKLGETVSVKDFGAKGDGVTDDTAAITAALQSGAIQVVIPAGTYKITSRITIPTKTNLFGAGKGATTITCANGDIAQFFCNSASNVTIRDFTINITAVGTTSLIGGIQFNSSNYCTVERVEVIGASWAGVLLYNSSYCTVSDCYFHDFLGTVQDSADVCVYNASSFNNIVGNKCYGRYVGIFVQGSNAGGNPLKNIISGNRVGQHDCYGILSYGVNYVDTYTQIIGNYVENIQGTALSGASGAGIYVVGHGGVSITGNTIVNCCVQTSTLTLAPAGIGVNGIDATLAPVNITGNTVDGMTKYNGIYYVTDGASVGAGANITGNVVRMPSSNTTGTAAISVLSGSNVVISGNQITMPTATSTLNGIRYNANVAVTNAIVSNNVISGGNSASIRFSGSSTLTGAAISGNVCSGGSSTNIAFQFASVVGALVSGNYFSSTIASGGTIQHTGCTNVRYSNNVVLTTGVTSASFVGTNTNSYFDKTNFIDYTVGQVTNSGTGLINETLRNNQLLGGTAAVGDRVEQSVPVVGNPKGWRCTVAGSPGTWVSEGNL